MSALMCGKVESGATVASTGARTWRLHKLLLLGLVYSTALGARPATADPALDDSTERTEATFVADDAMDDIDLLELEVPIVVTASRRAQKITTVPYAMSVITAEDIRRSGARWIPDALRLVPGVDVAEFNFSQAAVSPRGFHGFLADKTLVLVDGRQLFDSVIGGTLWDAWPFQLEDIERIEVIRGPAGVTWGANAVNGVINIITKDPADQAGLTFSAGGGSRGWHKEHLGYAEAGERWRFRISGEYEASDGVLRGGSVLGRPDEATKAGRMAGRLIHDLDPNNTLTFSIGSSITDSGHLGSSLAALGNKADTATQANYVQINWTHRVAEDNTVELAGYVNDVFGCSGLGSIDYRYQQFALQLRHTFKPSDPHTLTWGLDSRTDLLDGTNANPFMLTRNYVSTAIVGLYIQDEWRLAPKWTLNLGGRIDYEFYGGFQPSARAALSHQISDQATVYAAVSRGFQMPPAGRRFLDFPLVAGLVRTVADRNFKPQALVAYELGYRSRHFDRLDLSLNLFWHEYAEIWTMSPGLGPPGLIRVSADNAGDASLYGVELEGRLAVTKSLTLLANYTYQELDWRSDRAFHETDTMSPPKHKFMVGARYDATDDLNLAAHLYYVDAVQAPDPALMLIPKHIDPYFRLDLRAEQEFWDDRASFAVGVRNLLDSHHAEGTSTLFNSAEVPRMVFAEFRVRFE
ncbi:MAG: TonB-dependent receptor [bacterium]|nr:TonB-dependent receptor [bacterium]